MWRGDVKKLRREGARQGPGGRPGSLRQEARPASPCPANAGKGRRQGGPPDARPGAHCSRCPQGGRAVRTGRGKYSPSEGEDGLETL